MRHGLQMPFEQKACAIKLRNSYAEASQEPALHTRERCQTKVEVGHRRLYVSKSFTDAGREKRIDVSPQPCPDTRLHLMSTEPRPTND